MATPATLERRRLADLMLQVGPDAPTLCGEWTTRDLAAHLVVRDRRPDAAGGILVSALSSYTEKVQDSYAERDYVELVELVRGGPPIWSPMRVDAVDRVANTAEFFVHHEDVRRAADDWSARDLDSALSDDLDRVLRRGAKLLARKAPAGITLEPDAGRARIIVHDAEPMVIVRGAIGELVLWQYGRQDHALVDYDGPDGAVDQLRSASFGI